jgi:glycosyltransferase involved in cell wall biosynthesis
MIKSNKRCILFTQFFPYGDTEVFVERELNYLSNYFKEVIIFPLNHSKILYRSVPKNVKVINVFDDLEIKKHKIKFLLTNFFTIINLLCYEFISHPFSSLKNSRRLMSDIIFQLRKVQLLKDKFFDFYDSDTILYSFWFDRWVIILSLLIGRDTKHKLYCRAHAFDLYEEDNRDGYILYRKFQFQNIKKVFSVSVHGEKYLKKRYPVFKDKIVTSYLGTLHHNNLNPLNVSSNNFIIISCGSVQKRKRILEFVNVLNNLPANYKWIHFGDGPDFNELINKINLKKLEQRVVLMGHIDNNIFMNYLKNNSVNLFLSLSSNEGLPYSMMEAISFGIPLMATNVGGCAEICNNNTGILIEKDFDVKNVAEKIITFSNSDMNSQSFRYGIRKFWEEYFNAEKNYYEFYKTISS